MSTSVPDLFTPIQPKQRTRTQERAGQKLAPRLGTISARVREFVLNRREQGATPKEIADALGLDKVTIRARCTDHHQAGHFVRTKDTRNDEHVYVAGAFWQSWMGSEPSKPHKGKQQRGAE